MKKLILLIMFIMCLSFVTATTHNLVVDDNSPPDDVLMMSAVSSYLITQGEDSVLVVQSKYTPNDDVITMFMYFGEALMIVPPEYESLSESIINFMQDNYGITPEIKTTEEEVDDNLVNEIPVEDLPEEAKGLVFALNSIDPLIIYGDGDVEASEEINTDYSAETKIHEDVDSFDILTSDLLIIGGPCANSYWKLYSNETCDTWSYNEEQALVKLVRQANTKVVLIAGTTQEDTLNVVDQIILNNLDEEMKGKTEVVIDLN